MYLQLFAAFLGSLGFSLLFGLRRRYLLLASLGGCLCWGIYLLCSIGGLADFPANLLAAAFSALYGELLARFMKAPAPLFCIPTLIPLVPGSKLYYTMNHAVQGKLEAAADYGMETLLAALAIAAGISFVWAAFIMVDRALLYRHQKKESTS